MKKSGLNKTVSFSLTQGYSTGHSYQWPLFLWSQTESALQAVGQRRVSDTGQRANPRVS